MMILNKSQTRAAYIVDRVLKTLTGQGSLGIRVLAYHYVNADSVVSFERQLEFLKEQFEILDLKSLLAFAPGKSAPPKKPRLHLTFDDGYQKVHHLGVPLLRKHGIPATFFVCSDFISETIVPTDAWKKFYTTMTRQETSIDPLITWGELRELVKFGFEIGSHTATHPRLSTLTTAELYDQLKRSKDVLQTKLNIPIRSIAIPYGDQLSFNAKVIHAIQETGYEICFTGLRGMNLPMNLSQVDRHPIQPKWSIHKVRAFLW